MPAWGYEVQKSRLVKAITLRGYADSPVYHPPPSSFTACIKLLPVLRYSDEYSSRKLLVSGSPTVRDLTYPRSSCSVKAKFHYAIQLASWFASWSATC